MTSRERVLAAINHRIPDKIPIDFGATPSTGISAIAYSRLKKHLGISVGKTKVYDVVQQLAEPEPMILDRFGVDVLDVGRAFNRSDENWYEFTLHGERLHYPKWFTPLYLSNGGYQVINGENILAQMPSQGYFYDQVHFPFKNRYPANYDQLPEAMGEVMWNYLPTSPWDHSTESHFWKDLREKCLHLRATTDKALVIGVGCNLFEWGSFLRGMDGFLSDLLRRPEQVKQFLDALMELHLSTLEKVCKSVGDIVDIVKFGDDLGENDRPFMRPSIYRKIFKPYHAQLCEYVKKHSSMHTMLHSCGAIYPLIPDLIEVGFEILNPVQINCANMDPVRLKQEFGDQLTFWGGGADTRGVLISGTPLQVNNHVMGLLDIFSKDGGYVFNSVHNILPDVPPANIVAMFDAVRDYSIE